MKLVWGPSKSTLQWLWLYGNINQFFFYIWVGELGFLDAL